MHVAGAGIEVLTWGKRHAPGLLLLHGFEAHADWWSFLAPLLARDRRVIALSWSGMGRSQWRDAYDYPIYLSEALAVAEAGGLFESSRPPVVAGHSFGAKLLISAAATWGERLAGAIIIDCYLPPEDEPLIARARPRAIARKVYATESEAIARFRFTPRQTSGHRYIVDHVARHSLRSAATGHGWSWSSDPQLESKLQHAAVGPMLARARCPLALVAGERSSLMTASVRRNLRNLAPPGTPWITVPDADHHIMIDQPLALAAVLDAIASLWQAAQPRQAVGEYR